MADPVDIKKKRMEKEFKKRIDKGYKTIKEKEVQKTFTCRVCGHNRFFHIPLWLPQIPPVYYCQNCTTLFVDHLKFSF